MAIYQTPTAALICTLAWSDHLIAQNVNDGFQPDADGNVFALAV